MISKGYCNSSTPSEELVCFTGKTMIRSHTCRTNRQHK